MRYRFRLGVGSLIVWWVLLCPAAEAWWNEDWAYRKQITLAPDAVAAAAALDGDLILPIRLHHGNFGFFLDTLQDGSDLRFVGADDVTPLPFHIERYDQLTGIALLWVRLPRPGAGQDSFWMYYGNPEAVSASQPERSYPPDQTLVLHFNELAGLPLDSTAFAHHPIQFTGALLAPGQIGNAAAFTPEAQLLLPATPALALDGARGQSLSFWIRLAADVTERAGIVQFGDETTRLVIDLEQNRLLAELATPEGTHRLDALSVLGPNRWYHVALTLDGDAMTLFVDGEAAGAAAVPRVAAEGNLVVGAGTEKPGFAGTLDELRLASAARPAAAFRLAAQGESPETDILVFGEDEAADSGSGVAEYFALIFSLSESIRIEGWIILLMLCAIGIAALDVVVTKAMLLKRAERADTAFLDGFRRQTGTDLAASTGVTEQENAAFRHSGAFQIYRTGLEEYAQFAETGVRQLGAEGIEVVRAGMDARLVEEMDRLNARLVVLTIGVSGGPFLGLLGTVLGVMVTFATIAQAGDVNVNTIAPGVAAALTTTVMGLIVAIPSLFGYNYVAGRIARRITVMEVFIDQFIAKLTKALHSQGGGTAGERHAA